MHYFKARKETTYGSRLVSPGEVVAMHLDEGQAPPADIWEPVGEASPHAGLSIVDRDVGMEPGPSGPSALAADMPPAMLMDQAKAQHEYQQRQIEALEQKERVLRQQAAETEGENTRLMGELAAMTTERDEIHAALMQKRQDITALHEERQAMQAEHVELMEKAQAEVDSLKAEITTLKKKK